MMIHQLILMLSQTDVQETDVPDDKDVAQWEEMSYGDCFVDIDGDDFYLAEQKAYDDHIVISEEGETVLRNEIGKYFELKESSIGPPNIYLGGKMRKVVLDNGVEAWAFGSSSVMSTNSGSLVVAALWFILA